MRFFLWRDLFEIAWYWASEYMEIWFKTMNTIKGGKKVSWAIHRSLLLLVPRNCIISYKAQGKDISPIIIDLCPPKGLNIDSNFAYVMLSLSTAKRGDNVLGSVRPSVRLFACRFVCAECSKEQKEALPVQSVCLCACYQWAYADNRADAVDRLLML